MVMGILDGGEGIQRQYPQPARVASVCVDGVESSQQALSLASGIGWDGLQSHWLSSAFLP